MSSRDYRAHFRGHPLLPFADRLRSHRQAARLCCRCGRCGNTVRSTHDCIVAQAALEQSP